MSGINTIIKNVCAFILLTTVINNLLYGSAYRKYIRFFSGLVVVILLCHPVLELFMSDMTLSDYINEYIALSDGNLLFGDATTGGSSRLAAEDNLMYETVLRESVRQMIEEKGFWAERIDVVFESESRKESNETNNSTANNTTNINATNTIKSIYVKLSSKHTSSDKLELKAYLADALDLRHGQVGIE